MVKRYLIISGLLLLLFNLASQGALGAGYTPILGALGMVGHAHADGNDIGFHYHPVSEHGSITASGQFIDHLQKMHYGKTCLATCLHATILPIPNEKRGSSHYFRSFSLVGADIWHLGVSSGGIPS